MYTEKPYEEKSCVYTPAASWNKLSTSKATQKITYSYKQFCNYVRMDRFNIYTYLLFIFIYECFFLVPGFKYNL